MRLAISLVLVAACASPPAAVSSPTPSNVPPAETTAANHLSAPPPDRPQPRVAKNWIVCERALGATRWLLVEGMLLQGSDEPAADSDYVVRKIVDEGYARSSRLPVQTLTIPRFYTLPEPFSVTLHVDTDPPGARVYEVAASGVLVPHGQAPVDITFAGDVSDLRVRLAGSTWLAKEIDRGGLTAPLWAGTDVAGSTADLSPVAAPLLDSHDLDALRSGTHKLVKHFTLSVHAPLTPRQRSLVQTAVILNVNVHSP